MHVHVHVESDAFIQPLLEVRTEATFEFVKLTNLALSPRQEEYAYKTTVRIGGRFFQGLLFDQGVDRSINVPTTATTTREATNVQHLELLQLASTNSNPMMDFESLYTSGNIHVPLCHQSYLGIVQCSYLDLRGGIELIYTFNLVDGLASIIMSL